MDVKTTGASSSDLGGNCSFSIVNILRDESNDRNCSASRRTGMSTVSLPLLVSS